MSAELELAHRRIAELELKIKAIMGAEDELRLLPNGDLHRGIKLEDAKKPNIDVEVIPKHMQNPIDRAIARILEAAKGGHELTCLWCGIQYPAHSSDNYKELREHLKKDHASVFADDEGLTSQVLMANLEEAKQRLAAAGV